MRSLPSSRWTRLLALVVCLGTTHAFAYEVPRYFTLFVKGGGAGYVGDLGRYTLIGPTYGVALGIQPVKFFGVEIGYDGSRNETPSAYGANAFWRNGGSVLAKLSIPIPVVRPFVGAGFGVDFVTVTGPSGSSFSNSFFEEVPVAAGIECDLGPLTAGARFTYHFMFNQGFVNVDGVAIRGGLADVQLTLGARF